MVVAKRERYSIAGLVMRVEGVKAFKHGVALFPGHPGIMKLEVESGQPHFEMRGNFLVRSRRHWVDDETLVTVVDARHAARMNPKRARRLILTSSVWGPTRNGPGLSGAKFEDLASALLWVHHEDDPCQYTAYRDAKRDAERTRAPLVTVRGGGPEKGGACQAFTAHAFVGLEREVVLAMRSWVKSGIVPADLSR